MTVRAGTIRILGIDPGLTRTGFGVIEASGAETTTLACGTLRTSSKAAPSERLAALAVQVSELMDAWGPDEVAVERIFLKLNAQTAVPAIQALGVSLMAAGSRGLPVSEYTPAQVKQAVVGVGSAAKEQVAYMVERLTSPAKGVAPDTPDAADAVAVAVCHLHSRGAALISRGSRGSVASSEGEAS
jgi:crossover junction endodeoxyribonuclease RuvC